MHTKINKESMALKKMKNLMHKRVIEHNFIKGILAKSLCFSTKNYKRGSLSSIVQCQKMKKTMKIKKKLKKKEERRKKKEERRKKKEERRRS